jgi:rhodanese-related sulfurtransferase
MAARLAAKLGYTNIKVYHAGAPAWSKDGNPLLTTSEYVSKRLDNLIIIDTRSPEVAQKGHIQGAVAIPTNKVLNEKNQFPMDSRARIVFYAQDTNLSELAPVFKEISYWGDYNMSVLEGGYAGWMKKGGATQSGKVSTKIYYVPRPQPGEIVSDEFINIVSIQPEDKFILDVRSPEETAEGKIEGAVNIPVDELQGRLNELPKGKEIIIHCGTGVRAEMAYSILTNAGFNARFLNDKVAIQGTRVLCCYKEVNP